MNIDRRIGEWNTRAAAASALVAMAVLAGCGGSVSEKTSVSASSTTTPGGSTGATPAPSSDMSQLSAQYKGPLPATEAYPETSLNLAPPQSSDQPAASWSAAFNTCATGSRCYSGTPIDIFLARATDPSAGEANPDGSINPTLNNRLVYILRQSNIPCAPAGGPSIPSSTAPKVYQCTALNFVDASTAVPLYTIESPGLNPGSQTAKSS